MQAAAAKNEVTLKWTHWSHCDQPIPLSSQRTGWFRNEMLNVCVESYITVAIQAGMAYRITVHTQDYLCCYLKTFAVHTNIKYDLGLTLDT